MQDKTLKILEYISSNPHDSTIHAISIHTGISKSTVHRIVRSLVDDYVVSPLPKGGYNLTPKLFTIAINGLEQKTILDHAVSILRDMSQATKETVSFYVLSGSERICLYHIEGEYPYVRAKIGAKGLIFKGSVGMVMAAFMDRKKLEAIRENYISEGRISPEQIDSVMEQLPAIKEQGYAVSMGQRHPSVASIAVPILDICGCVTAALAIATDIDRMTPKAIDEYSKMLKKVARQVCM